MNGEARTIADVCAEIAGAHAIAARERLDTREGLLRLGQQLDKYARQLEAASRELAESPEAPR